jgi:hypothetical protein
MIKTNKKDQNKMLQNENQKNNKLNTKYLIYQKNNFF